MSTYGDKLNELAQRRGEPFRVLIVDDESSVREVYGDFCRLTEACQVDLAHSGEDALEKVRNQTYDIITLDLIMPEMSGLEVLAEVKAIAPRVPVMIVTGNATERLVNRAGVLGACTVMYKPVTLEDFLETLAATLERHC